MAEVSVTVQSPKALNFSAEKCFGKRIRALVIDMQHMFRACHPASDKELLERAGEVFGAGAGESEAEREKVRELHEKIGQLTMERDFLSGALGRFPAPSGRG